MGSKRKKQVSPRFIHSESEEARQSLAGGIRRFKGSGPPRVSEDSGPPGTTGALMATLQEPCKCRVGYRRDAAASGLYVREAADAISGNPNPMQHIL